MLLRLDLVDTDTTRDRAVRRFDVCGHVGVLRPRGIGGGDVKILAVAFLWTGLSGALPFAILLALFSGAHSLAAKLGWAKSQITASERRRIPFAPSVAAALICTFMLRSLQLA
jgi:Flp pilus assembly protein protease CpaA